MVSRKILSLLWIVSFVFLSFDAAALVQDRTAIPKEEKESNDGAAQYNRCMDLVGTDAKKAVALALEWQSRAGGTPARHCEALGLFGLGKFRPSALMLDRVAEEMRKGIDMPIIDGKRQVARAPMLAMVYGQAANAWTKAGNMEQALKAADSAVLVAPKGSEIEYDKRLDRALILAKDGDYEAAYADLKLVKTHYKNRSDLLLLFASAARLSGRPKECLEALTEILVRDTDNITALMERGNVLAEMKFQKKAMDDWFRVIALAPDSPEAAFARKNIQALAIKGSDEK